MNPRSVIESIRREFTGEGLENNQQWKDVVQRNNDTLSRALKQLSENLYKKEFHFIMELIQNAEDNQYKGRPKPYISFTLFEDRLVVRNNEAGFTEENVRAICDVNKTTKKKIDGYIGEKGIGFKSVFKVSDRPEIYSNGFRFRFNSKVKNKAELKYILPEWIEEIPNYINDKVTNIVLPFRAKNRKKFSEQLDQIHPNLMLFLKKITKIEIQDVIKEEKLVLEKTVINDQIIRLSKHTTDRQGFRETEHFYYLFRSYNYNVNQRVTQYSEERKGLKSTEIIIGFPLQKERKGFKLLTNQDCDLYAYLPIKDVGFRFLIQADFILNSGREDIDEAKPWNEWVMNKINLAVTDALLSLRTTPFWKNYLNYLPSLNEMNDDSFKNLANKIIETISGKKIIPVGPGDEIFWQVPSKTMKYEQEVADIFTHFWIKSIIKKDLMHPKAELDDRVSDLFELDWWEWDYVIECLKNKRFIMSLTEPMRNRLYAYLLKESKSNWERESELKDLPILFVINSKKPQSFNDSSDGVFWPLDSNYNYSFLDEIRFLSNNFKQSKTKESKDIRDLFSSLGVKNASVYFIIMNFIIPKFNDDESSGNINKIISKHKKDVFRFLVENYNTIKRNSYLLNKIKENIWLYSNDSKSFYQPDRLYLGQPYQPKFNFESFLKKTNALFISPQYIDGLSKAQKKDATKLLYDLGVNRYAEITNLVECFESGSLVSLKPALVYLDKNWRNYENKHDIGDLRAAIVIPIRKSLYKPSQVFMANRLNKRILKESVPYLPNYIKNNDFISGIGVNVNRIPSSYLLDILRGYKGKKPKDPARLLDIYRAFNFESEITDVFNDEKLIYCFHKKTWIYSWQALWSSDDESLRPVFSELNNQYPESLRSFFIDNVGVNINLAFSNIKKFLEKVSENENVNEEFRINIEHALVFTFAQLSRRKVKISEIEDLKEIKCIPAEDNRLCYPEDVLFIDIPELYNVFRLNNNKFLFRLSSQNSGFRNFLKGVVHHIGIENISDKISTQVENIKRFKQDKVLAEHIKSLIRYISYVVHFRFKQIFNELNHLQKKPDKLKCMISDKVNVIYSLDDYQKVVEEQFWIMNGTIFLKNRIDEDSSNWIQKLLFRFFDNHEELKDLIFFMAGIDNHDGFKKYLELYDIPVPQSESDLTIWKEQKAGRSMNFEFDEKDESDQLEIEPNGKKSKVPRSKEKPKNVIKVNNLEWQPESEPDFIVEIEHTSLGQTESESNSDLVESIGKKPGSFPSYQFGLLNSNIEEIGIWSEMFVFKNLIEELKAQFSEYKHTYKDEEGVFEIIDNTERQVAKIINHNIKGITQSGYDFSRVINGKCTYLEVKSSETFNSARYILSKEQWRCCRENPDNFELYIVKGAGRKNAKIIHIPDFYSRVQKGIIHVIPHNLEVFI